jgi:hypothetical protein
MGGVRGGGILGGIMNITKNFQNWYKDFTCGHCYKKLGFDIRYAEAEYFDDPEGLEYANGQGFVVIKCRHCNFLNIIILNIKGDDYGASFDDEYEFDAYLAENPDIVASEWFEHSRPTSFAFMRYQGQYPCGLELSDNIPEQIRGSIREAFNCLAVNASNASVMMSRRVVQEVALNFGVARNMFLGTALNTLKEKGLISDELYEALIEVKNWGDGGAHPGKIEIIHLYEARKVAELVLILVKSVFPANDDPKSLVDELKRIRQGKSR